MTVDHDLREAVVAVVGGEVVGVARYDRSPDDPATAEFAILVEDALAGRRAWAVSCWPSSSSLAADRGVRTLTATVQPDNDRVIGLIRRLLPGATFTPDADVLDVAAPCSRPALRPAAPEIREEPP